MTWLYIGLAVVVIGWFIWVTCKVMYVMGRDVPQPPMPEPPPVLCFRCGVAIPDSELATHTCEPEVEHHDYSDSDFY